MEEDRKLRSNGSCSCRCSVRWSKQRTITSALRTIMKSVQRRRVVKPLEKGFVRGEVLLKSRSRRSPLLESRLKEKM